MLEALTKDVIHVAQATAPSLVVPYVVQLENMYQAQRRLFVSLALRTPTEILKALALDGKKNTHTLLLTFFILFNSLISTFSPVAL
jgi:hypothetical protein